MKPKLAKRCFAFLRRVHENEREKSRSEVDVHFMEESYASTHRIAECNRRIKLSQQFMALRNILPHNPKKGDKFSILSNAIVELNQLKLRIKDLEQRNKMLMNEVTQHPCEDYSSMTYGDEKICNFNCISSKSHRKCKRNLELPAVLRCNPKNWLVNL